MCLFSILIYNFDKITLHRVVMREIEITQYYINRYIYGE